MRSLFLLLAALILHADVAAQRRITPTDTLYFNGEIKKELALSLNEIDTTAAVQVNDLIIKNQQGEIKNTLKNLKGILLKNLMDSLKFKVDKPRELNEFYFVFEASDGYKVVFSWNEIFNTSTGNNLYLITQLNGKYILNQDERILIVAASDIAIGRRYIKGVKRITAKRI